VLLSEASSSGLKPVERVQCLRTAEKLEVQLFLTKRAAVAGQSDHLALLNVLVLLDMDLVKMRVQRVVILAV